MHDGVRCTMYTMYISKVIPHNDIIHTTFLEECTRSALLLVQPTNSARTARAEEERRYIVM